LPELRSLLIERGLHIEHLDGSASLWVRGLYPGWLRHGLPARLYEEATRRRPTLFGRDLILLARKGAA